MKRPRAAAKVSDSGSPKKKAKEGEVEEEEIDQQHDHQQQLTSTSSRTPVSFPAVHGHHDVASTSSRPTPSSLKQSEPTESMSKSKSIPPLEPLASSRSRVTLPPSSPPTRGDVATNPGKSPSTKKAGGATAIASKVSMENGATVGPAAPATDVDDPKSASSRSSQTNASNRWLKLFAVPILLLSNILLYCVWYDTAWQLEVAVYERDQALRHVGVLKETIQHLSKDVTTHQELLDRHHDAFDQAMEEMQTKLLEQEELMDEVQATCYDALEEAYGDYGDEYDERDADSRDNAED